MRPASEPKLTTTPPLRAIMPSRTARVQLIMPQRLIWISFSHSARSFSTKSRSSVQPTLLTSTSILPARPSTSRTMAWTDSHLVTSVGTTTAEAAPPFRASTAVFSPCPASISATVTCAPSRAKASAMARPMFDPLPVTMTLLPLRFSSIACVLSLLVRLPGYRLATVKIHGLPGHEVGSRRGQVHGQRRRLGRLAQAPRRHLGEKALPRVRGGHGRARDVGVHVAGREAVDLYAVLGPLGGEASSESIYRRLARAVRGVAGHAEAAIHGADVDDLAPPARDHAGRYRARAAEHRREVGREHLIPLVVADVHRLLLERNAGVVDEDVDRTERFFSFL